MNGNTKKKNIYDKNIRQCWQKPVSEVRIRQAHHINASSIRTNEPTKKMLLIAQVIRLGSQRKKFKWHALQKSFPHCHVEHILKSSYAKRKNRFANFATAASVNELVCRIRPFYFYISPQKKKK